MRSPGRLQLFAMTKVFEAAYGSFGFVREALLQTLTADVLKGSIATAGWQTRRDAERVQGPSLSCRFHPAVRTLVPGRVLKPCA